MKRVICCALALIITVLLAVVCTTAAHAEELPGAQETVQETAQETVQETEPETEPETSRETTSETTQEAQNTETTEESAGEDSAGEGPSGDGDKLLSEQIWDTILTYKDDLLSLAGLIISIVLAYVFKKGLVPLVERIFAKLSAEIGNSMGKLNESSKTLNGTMKDVKALMEKVEKYSELLNNAKTREDATARLLYEQTEMLYQLISNSDTTVAVQNKATEVYNASLTAIKAMYGDAGKSEVTKRDE